MTTPSWICCQLGAREHYSVPRAMQLRNQLGLLVTDVWNDSSADSGLSAGARAKGRFHPELRSANIRAWNWGYLANELFVRLRRDNWDRILARNDWFQLRALSALRAFRDRNPDKSVVLFAYSYAARRIFEFARQAGWRTVLGQIDGGLGEHRLIGDIQRGLRGYENDWTPGPDRYWDGWKEECALADRIVVNSDWSRRCLTSVGIQADKLVTIPLAYEPPAAAQSFTRDVPRHFTADRPLRILFLGQVTVRKGVTAIFDSLDDLKGEPVEFRMVGPVTIGLSDAIRNHPQIRWVGPVPRSEVAREYREADVLIFPTFSDGFGITQLEAQAWKLPVIASKNCGEVVRHLENGYILGNVSPAEIVSAIRWVLTDAGRLAAMSRNSSVGTAFTLRHLSDSLSELTGSIRQPV
jgi:glycosyltransferase involved in cell wall biosynthesis